MNEDKLIELLSNFDDDLVEKEVDKLLEGVEIDMDSINKKAHQKLNNNKKAKHKKRFPFVAVACVCLLCITTVYAKDISQAFKVFFNKTPIYSTMVDGDAYYLKESYNINDDIKIDTVMVSKGSLQIEITTDLSMNELGDINIIPENNTNIVYFTAAYNHRGNKYHFFFTNTKEVKKYNFIPFKDFKLIIGGSSYDVSLEKAKRLDVNNPIYMSDSTLNNIKGVNLGAQMLEAGGKLNIQLITAFEDKDLKLMSILEPTYTRTTMTSENTDQGRVTSSSSCGGWVDIYVEDKDNHKYKLKMPKDPQVYPVTLFETSAPKDEKLVLKVPTITVCYEKTVDSFSINIPNKGKVDLNKEIDFIYQKGVIKNIKRISSTSAELELELNTGVDENIKITAFGMHSPQIKKTSIIFSGNKWIADLEFDENIDSANFEISYPEFVMKGDWVINMNGSNKIEK